MFRKRVLAVLFSLSLALLGCSAGEPVKWEYATFQWYQNRGKQIVNSFSWETAAETVYFRDTDAPYLTGMRLFAERLAGDSLPFRSLAGPGHRLPEVFDVVGAAGWQMVAEQRWTQINPLSHLTDGDVLLVIHEFYFKRPRKN